MATILSIETSADVCSTALTSDGFILLHREEWESHNHAARLSGFIKESLDYLRERGDGRGINLDAVAVSTGPGSYTGLRIGMSEAKGLCFAMGLPLIGVNTLELLATAVMFKSLDLPLEPDALLCPMVDARRMEVYTAIYDEALQPVMEPQALVLEPDSLDSVLATGRRVALFGSGARKAMELIQRPELLLVEGIVPLATDMMALAERSWMRKDFLDLAYSVPTYLKPFQGTRPRRML